MIQAFEDLLEEARRRGPKRLVIAAAEDPPALEAADAARHQGLVCPVLVGDTEAIQKTAQAMAINVSDLELVAAESGEKAVHTAVKMVRDGKGEVLMKGHVATAIFLKGVLDEEVGLRTGRRLSHLAILEPTSYHKLLLLTDGGMNVKPDLDTKADIIRNAVEFAHHLGIAEPKVAVLAAVEVVREDMPETVEAAHLTKMGERGQLGECLVDGPLALDLAVSRQAAQQKGIESPVAGDADIVLVPDIASGNIFAKGLIFLSNARSAGIVLGTTKPVVMLSRADTPEMKLHSMALGVVTC
jgi:phosphate butyryltransferase